MIYIFIGEEDYLIEEKLDDLNFKNKVVFSLKDKELKQKLTQYLNQRLFSTEDICIVLKDGDKIDLDIDFLNFIKNKNVVFIFKQKTEVFLKKLKDLKIPHRVEEIPSLSFKKPEDFLGFLIKYTEQHNIHIPTKILSALSEVFLHHPTILLNDLKKLKYYKPNGTFTKEEILNLIRWPTDSQIFELVDALLDRKYENFIMRLKREIVIGTKIESIIGFLYKTLLRILLIKKIKPYQTKLLNTLDIKPAYQWKLREYSKKISEEEIKKILQTLSDLDRKYKKFILKEEDFVYEFTKTFQKSP
ncbi:MAG: hypothetical protein QXX45_03805 [Candidatus Aenigmatarchaeota archaeon]